MKTLSRIFILIFVLSGSINFNGCFDSNKEKLAVSTLNNKLQYNKDDVIEFRIKLTKDSKPVEGAYIGVNDNLSLVCANTAPTNRDGETVYKISAKTGGQYSFLFYHNNLETSSNFAIYINEKHTDNNFKPVVLKPETLPRLGENIETTQESFSQKSLDVSINTLKESATNPVFIGSGALCILGAGATVTGIGAPVGAPLAAFMCPAAFDVFMGSLLVNVTRNSIKNFETNEKKKEELLNIVNTANIMKSIVSFDDAILQSPKGGKDILSYKWDTPQSANAGGKALQRITKVSDIIVGVSLIENPKIEMIKEKDEIVGFVCSFIIPDKFQNETLEEIETKHMVTLGIYKRQQLCNPEELLSKNNINTLIDGSVDLVNKKIKIEDNQEKDIQPKYIVFSGSFTEKNANECLLYIQIEGDFSHAEGFGPQTCLIFDSNGKYLKEYKMPRMHNQQIKKVIDIDNDGFSEILSAIGACFQGCFSSLVVSHANLENILLERTIEATYPIGYGDECVTYECTYENKDNKLIFNSIFTYYPKTLKYEPNLKPNRTENYKDEFILENGGFNHINGSIENMEEYFKRFTIRDNNCN